MSDLVLAQNAYAAFAASTNHLDTLGMPLPSWEGLGEQTQAATLAAVAAIAAPADQAVRGVQQWMALDLHTALGNPTDHSGDNAYQGQPSWVDWWGSLLAQISNLRAENTRRKDLTLTLDRTRQHNAQLIANLRTENERYRHALKEIVFSGSCSCVIPSCPFGIADTALGYPHDGANRG